MRTVPTIIEMTKMRVMAKKVKAVICAILLFCLIRVSCRFERENAKERKKERREMKQTSKS